jgi:putative peptidoglycan lipid II flippase
MGYRGLALGTSITAIVNAGIQLFLLRREIHGIEGRRIAASFVRVVIASAVMGLVAWAIQRSMMDMMPGTSLTMQIFRLGTTITIALMTLGAMAQVLRIQEFAEARDLVVGKLKRTVG